MFLFNIQMIRDTGRTLADLKLSKTMPRMTFLTSETYPKFHRSLPKVMGFGLLTELWLG